MSDKTSVLMINGSPHANGCTFTGLSIIKERLAENGVDSEILHIGAKPVASCTACGACGFGKAGKCAFDGDLVNVAAQKLREADGLILGSPVHYSGPTGATKAFLDRLFYCTELEAKRFKFGACVVSCRRGGSSSTFDQLNKYFSISQMPVVPSGYWNGIHGQKPEDVYADAEGVWIMKTIADNMAYLIKCRKQSAVEPPKPLPRPFTNFVRQS